jgi:HD-like signal output (HDOD) protein
MSEIPDFKAIIEDMAPLGTLPSMMHELSCAIESPSSSVEDISSIIIKDSDLTARILRIANSAFYGFQAKVDKVSQAIMLIGTRQVHELIYASAAVDYFQRIPIEFVDMKKFWSHSLGCGVAAKTLSVYSGHLESETSFVCGILHDIGRLLLYVKSPAAMIQAFQKYQADGKSSLRKIETELFGFDHAYIGAELFKQWGFPVNIIETVAFHHKPSNSERFAREASVVHLADIMVHAMEMGSSGGERLVPSYDPKAWQILELKPSIIPPVISEIDQKTEEVFKVFFAND